MSIVVRNLNKRRRLNERFIRKLIESVLKILKEPLDTELEVAFLSDAAIRRVNKKYKHKDRPTDVLSFNLGSCGQILISSDTALRNCGIFKTSFEKELMLYVIHGILHFFGYEDETAEARQRMSKKENAVLERLCAKAGINLSKVLTRR